MKNTVKFLSVFLCIAIILTANFTVLAGSLTSTEFKQKLASAKALHPHGSQQYEWSVNGSVVGWQCHGYVRWITHYVWGVDFANGNGEGWSLYYATANSTPIDQLVPGDVLRYRTSPTKNSNHTIFITDIVDDTVYFTDCNSDGANTVKWERSLSKATLAEYLKRTLATFGTYGYIAHYAPNTLSATASLNISYNASGGVLNLPTQTVTEYTVVDSSGINLRSGAGTGFSRVGALPKGTVFTVSETANGNGYTWGKTIYNNITGWCVISESWTTKTEIVIPAPYYLNSAQNIFLNDGQKLFTQSFAFGNEYPEGLTDPAEFGLVREGYTFLGWSKTIDGQVVYNHTDPITPETLFPEAKEKEYSATLYAVWQSNKVLTEIEVASLPTKTKYLLNAPFNSSGLKIKLKYSNNAEETITEGFTLSGFDSQTAGEKSITVNYNGKTTTFTVLVEDLKTGDLNKDFNIDLMDVTILAQYVADWDVECDQTALDVTDDGYITLMDVVHLAQYVAGWEEIVLK